MELVLASRNTGKLNELRSLLDHLPIQVLSLDDISLEEEVVEDAETYEGNAAKKALSAAKASGRLAIADDSGLEIDALEGRPGPQSARFGGPGLSDHDRTLRVLELIKDVPDDRRGAAFRCVVSIATPRGVLKTVEGICRGVIVRNPRGGGGFGYDPVFVPADYNKTFAELSPDIKNRISHRAKALEKAALFLEGYLKATAD